MLACGAALVWAGSVDLVSDATDIGKSFDGVAVDFVDDPASGGIAGSIEGWCGSKNGAGGSDSGSGLSSVSSSCQKRTKTFAYSCNSFGLGCANGDCGHLLDV